MNILHIYCNCLPFEKCLAVMHVFYTFKLIGEIGIIAELSKVSSVETCGI